MGLLDHRLSLIRKFNFSPCDIFLRLFQLKLWVLALGFTLGYGALFSKTWTVYRLATHQKKEGGARISSWEIYVLLAMLLLIDVCIMTVWQVSERAIFHFRVTGGWAKERAVLLAYPSAWLSYLSWAAVRLLFDKDRCRRNGRRQRRDKRLEREARTLITSSGLLSLANSHVWHREPTYFSIFSEDRFSPAFDSADNMSRTFLEAVLIRLSKVSKLQIGLGRGLWSVASKKADDWHAWSCPYPVLTAHVKIIVFSFKNWWLPHFRRVITCKSIGFFHFFCSVARLPFSNTIKCGLFEVEAKTKRKWKEQSLLYNASFCFWRHFSSKTLCFISDSVNKKNNGFHSL